MKADWHLMFSYAASYYPGAASPCSGYNACIISTDNCLTTFDPKPLLAFFVVRSSIRPSFHLPFQYRLFRQTDLAFRYRECAFLHLSSTYNDPPC